MKVAPPLIRLGALRPPPELAMSVAGFKSCNRGVWAMSRWLGALGAASLITAAPANAQSVPVAADDIARVASSRVIDLRLSQDSGFDRPAPLVRELLVNRRGASNARIGWGGAQ